MKVLKMIMIVSLTLLAGSVYAKGMNKCIIDGKISYTHRNCPTNESQAAFGGRKLNVMNVSVNAMRYGAHAQKKANLAAKDINYREGRDGIIMASSSAKFHKKAKAKIQDAKLKDMNILVNKSDKIKEDTVKEVEGKKAKLEVTKDEKLIISQENVH